MILVTGGTGLLGSHLLVELAKKDYSIRAIFRNPKRIEGVRIIFSYYFQKDCEKFWNKIEWIEADILDIESMKLVMVDINAVYHAAGFVSFDGPDFKKCIKVNREGTANVVNLCLKYGIKKLGYVSSTAAVGGVEGKEITENDKWENTPWTSGYSVSKYLGEKEVWRGIEEGLNAVIINPCVILGPGNWEETSLTIFKTASKGMTFYPTGSNATVDARDVSACFVKLVESDVSNKRFLCTGTNQSFLELFGAIAVCNGKKKPSFAISKKMLMFLHLLTLPFFRILNLRHPFSKDTIHSAYKNLSYDHSAIVNTTHHTFYSLQETIQNTLNAKKFELESK